MMLDYIVKDKEQTYGDQRTPNGQFQLANSTTDALLSRHRSLASYQASIHANQTAASCAAELATGGAGNELIGYYFGSISRETAEWILRTHGKQADGAYLLRSSGPSDDFVLSLLVNPGSGQSAVTSINKGAQQQLEVLHYKIVETEDSFVALHGQVGDEKFATIDELIDKAQGVATKPRWPILRHSLEWHILPPTFWGLSVDQVRWAILIKARQWGFPLAAHLFQQQPDLPGGLNATRHQNQSHIASGAQETTLNNETIRTLIHKSLHEFQPWFHGKISREEAERRVEDCSSGWPVRDGRFLVRERDNYSYAMCISHRNTTKHYRIDVLPTGELAIQDGRKFTSLMALVSHYTITNDGLWCALTEACPRPIATQTLGTKQASSVASAGGGYQLTSMRANNTQALCNGDAGGPQVMCSGGPNSGLYCTAPSTIQSHRLSAANTGAEQTSHQKPVGFICAQQGSMASLKAPIKEWLQAINHRWSQLVASQRNNQSHSTSSLNSFLFGQQNPLNNHCVSRGRRNAHRRGYLTTSAQVGGLSSGMQQQPQHQQTVSRRKCKNGHLSCGCLGHQQQQLARQQVQQQMQTAPANGVIGKVIGANELTGCETMAARLQLGGGVDVSNGHMCANPVANCASYLKAGGAPPELVAAKLAQLSSGFALNGQSFVGSPLFAVNQFQQVSRRQHLKPEGCGGSSSGGSGESGASAAGGDSASELAARGDSTLRLVSPMQSVCGPATPLQQQTVDQIYESSRGCSSGLISGPNGRSSLTSSSLASSSHQLLSSHYGGSTASTLQAHSPRQMTASSQPQQLHQLDRHIQLQLQRQAKQLSPGPILCGQHAGPAFRYTNCHDQSHLRPCAHHRATTKALDDLQLPTGSSPLAPPAALTRFVQFQDGQCLRTHRDAQSIQQAYLWAATQHPPHTSGATKQMGQPTSRRPEPIYGNPSAKPAVSGFKHQQQQQLNQTSVARSKQQEEVDLMYCGDDEDHLLQHHFKYDPRQIKSSSIETLCGVGVDKDDEDAALDNCKSNSELIMSLQSYWSQGATTKQQPAYLSPTQLTCADAHPFPAAPQQQKQQPHLGNSTATAHALTGGGSSELLESHLRKKHDLDELTTTVLAELDASLKAQVELKNKRAGFCSLATGKASDNNQPHHLAPLGPQTQQPGQASPLPAVDWPPPAQVNPLELINEFDTLISNNR